MKRVAIVGAGPVGLVCAHLLALQKVSTVVFEKQSTLASHPSAHFIHSSSVEVLRNIGMLSHIQQEMPPSSDWRHFNYCQSVTGKVYRRHDQFGTQTLNLNRQLSDLDPMHFPQSKLVNLLAKTLPEQCELRLGCEVTRLQPFEGGVNIHTSTGTKVDADYVLGCDGAHSTVRRLLHIPMLGSPTLQHFLNIHFTSPELGRLCAASPSMLYFIYSPLTVAVLVMHNAKEGDFVMQVPFLPPLQDFAAFSNRDFLDLIDAAAGKHVNDARVNSVRPWRMSAEYAGSLRSGNVFLVGDSAHKLPPAGGFGMNLGLSDAHNICWKLNFPHLLDSYETERLPRIQQIVNLSKTNYEKTVQIAKMFNLDIDLAQSFEKVCEWLPLGRQVFDVGLRIGRLLIAEQRAMEFLREEKHLLDLFYPDADLRTKYAVGFFSKTGGNLGPNLTVSFENREVKAREVPNLVLRETGTPHFVHFRGLGETEIPEYVPLRVVSMEGKPSFVLRPDAVVYSSAGSS